ncbi:MAG: DUF3365 domain-containing protein [Planctomycetota bacterium]|nr:DUF3365 domain-containing protein [Planctomycetota bacterium]
MMNVTNLIRRSGSAIAFALGATLAVSSIGCGGAATPPVEASLPTNAGISPQKFSDAVHAVMMADRTVYAKQVVTRLKKQEAPVKPSEYWQDEDHTIPLPAQMFRMGAELVNDNPEAGFTYALKSQWPLNPQNLAEGTEIEGLKFIAENPTENFYKEEEIGGSRFFTAIYADKAVAAACWECHNEHANKGANYPIFKEGDVMGGVVVRIPLD